jgi:CBS domain-containing protein
MNGKRIRHVPVVDDDGVLVGLVTQRDVWRGTFPPDGNLLPSTEPAAFTGVRAGDIMTEEVETVQADESLEVAARLMLAGHYGCLPVIEDGQLTGMLTERDFVRLVAGIVDEGADDGDDGEDDAGDGESDEAGDDDPES